MGQFSASLGYIKYVKKVSKGFFLLLVPLILGSILLTRTDNSTFEFISSFLIIFAVLVFNYRPYIVSRIYGSIYLSKKSYYPSRSGSIQLSIYGGYYGGGFGLTMLVLFLSLNSLKSFHSINNLKIYLQLPKALFSIIILFNSELIHWKIGLILGKGALVGGYFGTRYAQKITLKYLRIMIIVVGLAIAIYFMSITSHIGFGDILKF